MFDTPSSLAGYSTEFQAYLTGEDLFIRNINLAIEALLFLGLIFLLILFYELASFRKTSETLLRIFYSIFCQRLWGYSGGLFLVVFVDIISGFTLRLLTDMYLFHLTIGFSMNIYLISFLLSNRDAVKYIRVRYKLNLGCESS